MKDARPIVVKKVKKGSHPHHGGAWKVAFADFTTAMMAFFLLLWLLAAATDHQKGSISEYFRNPSQLVGTANDPASVSMLIGAQGSSTSLISASQSGVAQGEGGMSDNSGANEDESEDLNEDLKNEMEELISSSVELKDHADQMMIDITPEGLRVQIVDKENRPMFELADASMKSHTEQLLSKLAGILARPRRKLSITGHTDTRVLARQNYTNWELSTDRANAARRILVRNGVDANDIARVVGLAAKVPLKKDDPHAAVNRRISIILLNDVKRDGNDAYHELKEKKMSASSKEDS